MSRTWNEAPTHCLQCGRKMYNRDPSQGEVRHGGQGLCNTHYKEARRKAQRERDKLEAKRVEALGDTLRDQALAPPSWQRDAACIGAGTDFTPRDQEPFLEVPERARRAAMYFCARCPVVAECGSWAASHYLPGLYGGVWFARDWSKRPDTPRGYRPLAILTDNARKALT